MSLKITVKHHALDQCEILVSGRRVAYMRYGADAKLNWLSNAYVKESGDVLTIEEKISIANFAKESLAKLTADRETRRQEVAGMIGKEELPKDFFSHDPIENTVGKTTQKKTPKKDR